MVWNKRKHTTVSILLFLLQLRLGPGFAPAAHTYTVPLMHTQFSWHSFKNYSPLFFMIPVVICLYFHFYWYAAVIVMAMTASMLYHGHSEKKFFFMDMALSLLLMLVNLVVLTLSGFLLPYSVISLVFVLVSFRFWVRAHKTQYNFNHTFWHLAGVIITLCCVLAYAKDADKI